MSTTNLRMRLERLEQAQKQSTFRPRWVRYAAGDGWADNDPGPPPSDDYVLVIIEYVSPSWPETTQPPAH